MFTRVTWLLGVLILISIGFLMACGSHFSASNNGLVIVPSQGSALVQAFSFDLNNGNPSTINTAPVVPGVPTAVVLDPAGSFAYVANTASVTVANSQNAIATYKVNSDGTLSAISTVSPVYTAPAQFFPVALAIDSAGKFLFVTNGATSDSSGNPVSGTISVFSIASGASLTEVSGSPFLVPADTAATANPVALAVTPTAFPNLVNSPCGLTTPVPTSESLYVVNSTANEVLNYAVDMSTGALTLTLPLAGSLSGFATGSVPSGVAVDSCNRFVYVSNQDSNTISAYTICNAAALTHCLSPDGSLASVGAAVASGNGPTAMAVDPASNFLYVVDTAGNQLSSYKLSQATGALTVLGTIATGTTPVAIGIRGDDNWLFVTDFGSTSVSQYALTPATGSLNPRLPITTNNFPFGIAVR
jgi:6-phosphogluconolactonase